MNIPANTTSPAEAIGWRVAKCFFFIVIVATMINAWAPAVSRSAPPGSRTVISGVIRASRTESLSVDFPASVVKVACQEGAMVKAGDLIMELASPELATQLESAKRRLQLAQLRASVSSHSSNAEFSKEQATSADRSVESVRRRLAEYSTAEQEASYASAQAHAKKVAALVERQLATEEELQTARISEQNELRSLQMARQTVSRLKEDLESALSQQRLARLSSGGPDEETRLIKDLELEQARHEYQLAEARSARLRVVAPFDGVVLSGLARPAGNLHSGYALARIADVSNLELEAQVASNIAKSLAVGASVEVRLPSDPPQMVTGNVMSSALAADGTSGGFILRVGIPRSESYRALLGMEGTVGIPH